MRIDFNRAQKVNRIKTIGTLAGIALGGLIGLVTSNYFSQRNVLLSSKKDLKSQKERIMSIINTARDEFSKKSDFPGKKDIQSFVNKGIKNIKYTTKPHF